MGAHMATYPISIQQLVNASDDAKALERYVNDDVPALIPTRLGGQKPNYAKFLADRDERFQQHLLALGYHDLGDYAVGIDVTVRNQIFRLDGEYWKAAASLDLPYTTTGDWLSESKNFVSVGDAALRYDLSQDPGSSMVGHLYADSGRPTSISRELWELRREAIQEARPALQPTRYYITAMRDDSSYGIASSGVAADRYHHSPRIVRDIAGRLHLVYSRALMHGYGGLVPPNAVDPQGQVIYQFSDDEGLTWSEEQVVCVALPPEPENVFRAVFDAHIGVCPSGRLVIAVSDIPPPSEIWGTYTGQTKYRWFINDRRGSMIEGGASAWVDKGVFYSAFNDYARVYCGRIKQIPKNGGGLRMAFSDYRQINATDYKIGMWYSDDEFETAPVEGSAIMEASGRNNETDFCFVDANLAFSISRSDGGMRITRNGGATWTKFADSSHYTRQLWEEGGLVAPIMDVVWRGGKPYVLLGYSHRGAGPDGPRWLVASVTDLFNLESAVISGQQFTPWGINYFSGPNVNGPAGYSSAVHYPDSGLVYADCTETTVSPNTGFMRSDVRIVRTNSAPWFPVQGGLMIGSNVSRLAQYNNNEVPYLPVLAGLGAAGSPAYSSRVGYNIRIGQLAFITAKLESSNFGGASGQVVLRGLPFAPMGVGIDTANNIDVKVLSALGGDVQAGDQIFGLFLQGSNQIALYRKANGSSAQALTIADLGGSVTLRISGFYLCANEGLT